MKFTERTLLIAATLSATLSLGTLHTSAQAAGPAPSQSPAQVQPASSLPALAQAQALRQPVGPTHTFYLANATEMNEGNEILAALRNMLNPETRITFVPSQKAILIRPTSPEQLENAQKIINDLDRPRKTYRLTYTITERDGSKTIGVQHYNLVAVPGQRTLLKEGSRVPVITANYPSSVSTGPKADVTYLDVGLNFEAMLEESSPGTRLHTKVEQSSIAEQPSGVGSQDPVIRQTLIEGSSIVTLGRSLVLGSIDIPGSTRHLDIEVTAESIK
jgi:type II secretory pathway component GspD/PulD (secretin)